MTERLTPGSFKRVWHLEPSLTDPDTVYAGVEDAALFRTTDGGQNWQELPGLRGPRLGTQVAARRPAACACTRSSSIRAIPRGSSSQSRPQSHFGRDDAGQTWKPINRGLTSKYLRTQMPRSDTAFIGWR